MKDKIRIIIADDDLLIQESLKIILQTEEDFLVAATVGNGRDAVNLCREGAADLALLDVRMPVLNGIEAAVEICGTTSVKVLMLTTFDEDEYIKEAIEAGASGYLLKNNSPEMIKSAVRSVAGGNAVLQQEVLQKIRGKLSELPEVDTAWLSEFSSREQDIIRLISKGNSNREIADKLFLTEGTVKNYISTILSKTSLQHRTQIAIRYLGGGERG